MPTCEAEGTEMTMKNIERNNAQVKQTSNESIRSAIRYLYPNKRQSGDRFAVSFAIVAAVLIWGTLLFILARIEFR